MLGISQKWRLDGLLNNQEVDHFCKEWLQNYAALQKKLDNPDELTQNIRLFQKLSTNFREFSSYAACLFSENVANPKGLELTSRAQEFETFLQKTESEIEKKLLIVEDLDAFILNNNFAEIGFWIRVKHKNAAQKMNLEKEALASDLSLHGYHSWYALYKQAISKMLVQVDTQELKGSFSCSQLDSLFSHASRNVRQGAHFGT